MGHGSSSSGDKGKGIQQFGSQPITNQPFGIQVQTIQSQGDILALSHGRGDSVTQLPLKDFYVCEQTLLFLPLLLIIPSFTIKIYIFRFGLNATGVIG